jgi:hypothetical protein
MRFSDHFTDIEESIRQKNICAQKIREILSLMSPAEEEEQRQVGVRFRSNQGEIDEEEDDEEGGSKREGRTTRRERRMEMKQIKKGENKEERRQWRRTLRAEFS